MNESNPKTNCANCTVILAGGQGKRMKSELPKPMFEVLGEPLLEWVMTACENADVKDMCIVKGYNAEVIESYVGDRCTTVFAAPAHGYRSRRYDGGGLAEGTP